MQLWELTGLIKMLLWMVYSRLIIVHHCIVFMFRSLGRILQFYCN